MFNFYELSQVKNILNNSLSLTDFEIRQAMFLLQTKGYCQIRDQGQTECELAYLPFVKLDPLRNGYLEISHW